MQNGVKFCGNKRRSLLPLPSQRLLNCHRDFSSSSRKQFCTKCTLCNKIVIKVVKVFAKYQRTTLSSLKH